MRGPVVLGIDPGTTQSAWLVLGPDGIAGFGILDNETLLTRLRSASPPSGVMHIDTTSNDSLLTRNVDVVAIEKVVSYGMAIGAETFETVYWSGRFAEAVHPLPILRPTKPEVGLFLCGSPRAKDANVRRALMDRYGGDGSIRKGGPLYKVTTHVWSALGVAITASALDYLGRKP